MFPEFVPGDYVIQDSRSGYFCAPVGTNQCFDSMIQEISDEMERRNFWPNVWYINDHGNTELIAIKRNNNGIATYETIGAWV